MKKIIALLLAVIMVMGLATVVSAETSAPAVDPDDTSKWVSDASSTAVALNKIYTVNGTTKTDLYPAETLKFTSTPDNSNPDTTNITVKDLEVKGNTNQTITVEIPSYSKVGVYKYTVAETEGNTQGVTYTKDTIGIEVLVSYNYTLKKLESKVVLTTINSAEYEGEEKKEGEDGKQDTFTNTYDVGSLAVSKAVTGNLGDKEKYFDITVEFTAATPVLSTITVSGGSHEDNVKSIAPNWTNNKASVTIKLKDGETLTFSDIPAGVTYTVVESDAYSKDTNKNGENGYDAPKYSLNKAEGTTESVNSGIEAKDTDTVEITNNKATDVETGIVMDSVPFIVMAVVAVLGVVAITAKKRVQE